MLTFSVLEATIKAAFEQYHIIWDCYVISWDRPTCLHCNVIRKSSGERHGALVKSVDIQCESCLGIVHTPTFILIWLEVL